MNQAISGDLKWAEHHIKILDRVILLQELSWTLNQADFTIFCDASLSGLGFWLPLSHKGFINSTSPSNMEGIFFWKALCVASALYEISQSSSQAWIVIYTDSDNTVKIFSLLHALPWFNSILKFCIDILITCKIQLKVLHVLEVYNQIADALFCQDLNCALRLIPTLSITSFEPPQDVLMIIPSSI